MGVPNIPVTDCCGCTACASACPTRAIDMKPNEEGFLYPSVNGDLCYSCHKCEKACPLINPAPVADAFSDCVVVQSKDEEVLNESTSGGFVDALCRYMIEEKGGYVCGVAFDSDFIPRHTIVDTYQEAKAFRNSKYAQSDLGTAFCDIKELLKQNKNVLFIGTPCQVAGLHSFLGKDFSRLVCVDLVCRSVPSPKLWRMYLDWQEQRYRSKITKVVCRKKTYGYHSGALEIDFENGKHYAGSNRVDYYMKSFHGDVCSRESCYNCKFKTKHRCSDFTAFDSWRPASVTTPPIVDNDRGYSNVLVHTDKGKEIVGSLKEIDLYSANADRLLSVMGSMVSASIKQKKERTSFYSDLNTQGFYRTAKKYSRISSKDRIIESLKPIRYKHRLRVASRQKSKE